MTVGKWNAMLKEFGITRSNFPKYQEIKSLASSTSKLYAISAHLTLTGLLKVGYVPERDYPLAKEGGR